MAHFADGPDPRGRRDRPYQQPYPDDNPMALDGYGNGYQTDPNQPRQARFDPRGPPTNAPGDLPPPPIGDDAIRPALKREGSRSRIPPNVRPEFPDEASYLGKNARDLEAKDKPHQRRFRERRDGYESEEGEMHRQARGPGGRRAPPPDDDYNRPPPDYRSRRPRDYDPYERDPYDDPPPRSRRPRDPRDNRDPRDDRDRRDPRDYRDDRDRYERDPYDDPPRRRRDDYDDEPPRRRRNAPAVEYGSDPVPVRRRHSDKRPTTSSRRRRDDYYSDEDEDDYDDRRRPPPRRRSSAPPRRRYEDDDESYLTDRSRRDRRDDRDDRDKRDKRNTLPKEIKIGNYE